MKPVLSFLLRFGVTAVVVAIAGVVAWQLWLYYMVAPWTRDGRVRADVVPVAADVSGLVSDVFVHDNQVVKKGDPLFRIDQKRFEFALAQAKAEAASRQATLDQGKRDLARSKALSSVVVTAQKVEQDQQAVDVQQAALDQATATLNVAKLNLERSTVTAPVNGIVTNFGLLPGRYVTAGAPILASAKRTASVPKRSQMSSGSTTFPLDFDIFCRSASRTMPVMYTARNGTSFMNFIPNIIIRATQKKIMSCAVTSSVDG